MFYTSSAKYLKCQQTYNLSLFLLNIAFDWNVRFCKAGLTNKWNYGNIRIEHVSLFTYYFVFVVPVHQHFALIQYKRYSDWTMKSWYFRIDISLRLSFTILPLQNKKIIFFFNIIHLSLHQSTQKQMYIDQNYFYNELKVMSKSIQSAWQLVIIEMTLIISVCFKLEQHFYYN